MIRRSRSSAISGWCRASSSSSSNSTRSPSRCTRAAVRCRRRRRNSNGPVMAAASASSEPAAHGRVISDDRLAATSRRLRRGAAAADRLLYRFCLLESGDCGGWLLNATGAGRFAFGGGFSGSVHARRNCGCGRGRPWRPSPDRHCRARRLPPLPRCGGLRWRFGRVAGAGGSAGCCSSPPQSRRSSQRSRSHRRYRIALPCRRNGGPSIRPAILVCRSQESDMSM